MNETVLIVEDEEKLAILLHEYLQHAEYSTCCLADGEAVVPWVKEHAPDLILLDLMLPGRTGFDICRDIRSFSTVPIIMITARIDEIDRLLGLDMGADDYICKPFSPREVVARVRTVLRRSNLRQESSNLLVLDEARHSATIYGQAMNLTTVEFKLLLLLQAHPGRLFSRAQLMARIYPDQRIVSDRTIDSHIKKLRRKLEVAAPDKELIHSVYGLGYKFDSA
jgi:two-component system response regulator BaeR